MDQYFDSILSLISGCQNLLILGPGETKVHLGKHLEARLPRTSIIHVEAADKMTDRQIAAHVREHFKKAVPILLSN